MIRPKGDNGILNASCDLHFDGWANNPEYKKHYECPMLLQFEELLTQKQKELEDKLDITKYQLLPETYKLIESKIKEIKELSIELKKWRGVK